MRDWTTKVDNTAPASTGILRAAEDNIRSVELNSAVTTAGISLDPIGGPDTDDDMLAQAMARYSSGGQWYQDNGAANAHVLVSPLAFIMPKAYFEGEEIAFYPAATNTGAVTVNVASKGNVALRNEIGVALTGGEIVFGYMVVARYYASGGYFRLMPWANRLNWEDVGAPTGPTTPGAPVTVYVRSDGNDANDGSANTAGGAFLTIQGAINALSTRYAPSVHTLTIQIGLAGTYGAASFDNGGGGLIIRVLGNTSSPATYIVDGSVGSSGTLGAALTCAGSRTLRVAGVRVQGTYGLLARNSCSMLIDGAMQFGTCTVDQMRADTSGSLTVSSNYAIVAGAVSHMYAVGANISNIGYTVTITGTPAFSLGFAVATSAGNLVAYSGSWSGSATGPRYIATANGIINTNGSGVNYFPGNSAGATSSGGIYL